MSEETTKMTRPTGDPDRTREEHRIARHRVRDRLARWRAWVRRHRALDLTWRAGVFVVGGACILAGMVMLVTPGPGWVSIIVGLAILASEFQWANGLLHWARRKATAAGTRAFDPAVRRRNIWLGVILLAVLAVLVGLGWLWVASHGWPDMLRPPVRWLRGLP